MKHTYKVNKTVDLPEYCGLEVSTSNSFVKFKLSSKRIFKYPKNGEMIVYSLLDSEVMYKTIYGWWVIVDVDSLIVTSVDTLYGGRKLKPITKEEYGTGSII